MKRFPWVLLVSLLSAGSLFAQFGALREPNVQIELKTDRAVAVPGETIHLVLEMNHPQDWNSYWINPGTGMGTRLKWTLPEGFETGKILWPIPKVKETEFGTNHIYTDRIHVVIPLVIPENAPQGEVTIGLRADWLECDPKGCVPAGTDVSLGLTVGDESRINEEVAGFVASVVEDQPRELEAWKVEVGGDSSTFEVRAVPAAGANSDPGKIYFFEASDSPNLAHELPEVTRDGETLVLRMKKSGDVPSSFIPGYLYAPKGWLEGGKVKTLAISAGASEEEAPFNPFAMEEPAPAVETRGPAPDEDKVAAGAKLYDPSVKPEYVLLDGEKEESLTLLPALGLVFIGGLLLNLMPCVFPVLGLKIMGFVSQAGSRPEKVKLHGMIFGLGVLVSMWILSGIIIALDLNWGAQLTNPAFVAGIVILLFAMGLNMAGVFEFGTSLTSVGGELQTKKGYSGSFFSGVLTTLIATPCSGPFLGSVMGFALSQKAPVAFLIFSFFALGIASPYIVFSFFPKMISRLPKPGAWMESFKKGMSFALFATAVFFLGSFAKQTGYDGVSWLLFALVVIGLAFWIYGTWGTPFQKRIKRYLIGYGLAIGVGLLGLQMTRVAAGKEAPALEVGGEWEPWFPGVVELSRSKKRIAWIDYTADW